MARVVDTVNMKSTPPPTAPGPDRPYHHGHLREALVDAAMQLARRGGPEAIVLRAVSRQAGVSHNAAYRHFADHDDLLAAVGERCMAALGALMVQRIAEVPGRAGVKRAWGRLFAIGRAYIDFAVSEPGWFRTAFASTSHGGPPEAPPKHATDGDVSRDPYALLSARLDELVEVGAVPASRRPGAEQAAWSMVHGLSCLLVDGPLRGMPAADRERVVAVVLGVVQRGL
jgi:AcrR family transcriptional regulator